MATITTSDAKKIASLSKGEGREELRNCLKWDTFDEDRNMRKSIHLDLLHDSIMFASEKGFSWNKVAAVLKFSDGILQQIQESDNITDILGYFNRSSSNMLTVLEERDFKVFTSFIFGTILPHFKLYKYIFTKDREEQIPKVPCKVEPPFDAKTLKETKPLNVWQYEKRVEDLEKKEQQRVLLRQSEKEQKLLEVKSESRDIVEKIKETEAPMDKEKIGNIIQEVMKQFTLSTTINLTHKIEDLREDLEFKLEKSSLPRPQALGPPPRYTTASVKMPSSKSPKSPKPGSRLSGKSKKK